MPKPIVEPSAEMREVAANMRQLYVALLDEGFTSHEAIALVGQTVSAAMAAPTRNEGDEGRRI